MIWPLLLLACFEPVTTSEGGMTGHIVKADGAPVPGLAISTVEARALTTDEGHFAIEYQPPSTYIDFRIGTTMYQRHYRATDAGKDVTIQLPETRDAALECAAEESCLALLSWNLPDGLIARTTARCEPGKSIPLAAVPVGPPQANCQQNITEPPAPIQFTDSGKTLQVGNPIYPYSVVVKTEDGKTARPCSLTIDGQSIPRDPNGLFVAKGYGRVVIEATCETTKLAPYEYKIVREGTVDLIWAAE